MQITSLAISGFRNIESISLSLHPSTNLIVGPNGSGKTSLLEAIFYLCTAKSFRSVNNDILIKKDSEVCRLKAVGEIKENDVEIEIAWGLNGRKIVKVDGVKLTKMSELYDNFHAISIIPQDIEVITGAPSLRRKLLDLYISQADRNYLSNLIDYNRILSQRNAFLKEFGFSEESDSSVEFDVWDERLVKFGAEIVKVRKEFISSYNDRLAHYYQLISANKDQLEWSYQSSFPENENQADSFQSKLRSNRRRDLATGITSVGPHRDDFLLKLNDLSAREYLSRGEAKSAALAIKFAIFEYLHSHLGDFPILLIDELPSDLDLFRIDSLLAILPGLGQVIITSARDDQFLDSASISFKAKILAGQIV